jgi:RNA polymerase sigma factor (sigma-70 family)
MLFTSRHAADGRIVKRVLSGHRDDFGILVDRYLPVVQAVAYARVQNRTEAEDVAQEAFIRAYEKLDLLREGGKFGPWISTIARNIALRTAQKRAREVPLEEQHLNLQSRPGRQRDETLQLLRECVDRLDEMPREMILLHYYAGKSLVEIAELLEISRDAVAKRLQRAREALSQEVIGQIDHLKPEPKQHALRKKAIVAAIGSLPAAWGASAATAGTGAAAGSALFATATGKLALAVLAFGTAAIIAWEAGVFSTGEAVAPAAPPPANLALAAPAVPATDIQLPDPVATNTDGAESTVLEEHGPGTIAGHVLDMQERPVPGATVIVEHITWKPSERPPSKTLRREAKADSSGYVSISDLPLGDYGILSHAGTLVDAISTGLSESSSVTEEDVVLKPGSPVGGVVIGADGDPVAGALVLPYQFSVLGDEVLPHEPTAVIRETTGDDGVFLFPRLWPGKWKFFVLAEGYAPIVSDFIRHKTSDAVIRLSPPLQATGTVVHADTGEALSGVHFIARHKNSDRDVHEVVSGEGGVFTLDNLAVGEYVVSVNDPSVIAARDPLTFMSDSKEPIVVPVCQGGIVTGRVYDKETGEGIGGIELYVSWHGKIVTDPLGSFIAMGLPPQDIYVQLESAPGYCMDEGNRSRQLTLPPGGEMQIDFALKKGVPLSGIVRDLEGNPVVGARVFIEKPGDNWWYASAKSGPGGRYTTREALPAKVSVTASKDNLQSRRQQNVIIPEEGRNDLDLVLDLIADAGIKGRISTASRSVSEANTNMQVQLRPLDKTLSIESGRVDLVGRFNVTDIVPGEYDVYIETQSPYYNECLAQRVTLYPGEVLEGLELTCKDQGALTIAGRVVDKNRQPIEGVRIAVPQTPMAQASSGVDGRFTIPGLEEGNVSLSLLHERYASQSLNDVPAGEQNLEIMMEQRSSVSGRVIDADTRQPIPSFEVVWTNGMVYRAGFWPGGSTPVTNESGQFSLEQVDPSDNITVYARATGYSTGKATVAVTPETGTTGVEIALEKGVIVRGTVVDTTGAPVSAAKIFLDTRPSQPEYEQPTTMTDANGHFRLDNLPQESVLLGAWSPAHAMAYVESPEGGGEVSLVLGQGGRIEGRVYLDNQLATQYSVNLKDGSEYDRHLQTGDLAAGLDGTFTADHVRPGEVMLMVALLKQSEKRADTYAHIRTQVVAVVVEDGQTTPVDVHFQSGRGNLHGRVHLDGEAAAGFVAHLVMQTERGEETFTGVELPGGYFSIVNVPYGTGQVTVLLFDLPLERTAEVTINQDGDSQREFFFNSTEVEQAAAADGTPPEWIEAWEAARGVAQ